MATISSDNHTHIILASIEDMISSARDKGIQRYSVTEHISQFKEVRKSIEFGSVHKSGRMFDGFGEYLAEFQRVGYPFSNGLTIRKGLEVDFSLRYEKKLGGYVNEEKWDFLICSVHEMEDGTEIENGKKRAITKTEAHKAWHDYLKLQNKAIESDFIPFDVLTHPVRISRRTLEVPEEFDTLLLELATNAKRRDKALELNGSDLEFAPDLVKQLAIACSKAGCKVSLGSDAHRPFEVYRGMIAAANLVRQYGLETI
jgi:histidinol-phosphatase (PHP family)